MTSVSLSKKVILATGGTGGHIFPAQALAEILIADGHHPIFITDARFATYSNQTIQLERIEKHVISAVPVTGSPLQKMQALAKNGAAYLNVRKLLKTIRPDAAIGFGGYPSLPTMLAAIHTCPTFIHEQNALLGKANRILASRVTHIATSFDIRLQLREKNQQKMQLVGNPVRASILQLRSLPYPELTHTHPIHVLITGGSQGASIFGEIIPSALALLTPEARFRMKIVQQVRPEQMESLTNIYKTMGVDATLAVFFHDMPNHLSKAHLVIARSGASTVAELTCAGRPAILVPLPTAAEDHQTVNARSMEAANAAWVIPQKIFSPEILAKQLEAYLASPDLLIQAADASHRLGKPEAAKQLAEMIYRTWNKPS
jgi:UDP-N-acetylglucosamine--N-acetylmuramyl-(pentapeptide) pyrophosphoryl-undecaprenol N-acetylglucosamine transferase